VSSYELGITSPDIENTAALCPATPAPICTGGFAKGSLSLDERRPGKEKLTAKLSKVHELLGRRGVVVPYSTLHRYASAHCGFQDARRIAVRRAECAPGELAEVDFGRLGLVFGPETGRRRVAHALLVTLVYSRHQYVHVTFSQKVEDLIGGLDDAWEWFGGVAAHVVLDNLKAAVTKPDRYEPLFARTFAEYAAWRGFVIDAALARHATGKPHVERNVQYLRESFFRGEDFVDLSHLQREALRWCRETPGQRIHGTTRRRPLVVFEEQERGALRPLERPRFDPPVWAACKVHGDPHVQFQWALYSVPIRHVGQTAWCAATRSSSASTSLHNHMRRACARPTTRRPRPQVRP
jgi:transposase